MVLLYWYSIMSSSSQSQISVTNLKSIDARSARSGIRRFQGQHWVNIYRDNGNTWTNVDSSSVKFSDNYPRAISQVTHQPSITNISLKIVHLKFYLSLPGTNELNLTCSLSPALEFWPIKCQSRGLYRWAQKLFINMPADVLAPNGSRPSASEVVTSKLHLFSSFYQVSLAIDDSE